MEIIFPLDFNHNSICKVKCCVKIRILFFVHFPFLFLEWGFFSERASWRLLKQTIRSIIDNLFTLLGTCSLYILIRLKTLFWKQNSNNHDIVWNTVLILVIVTNSVYNSPIVQYVITKSRFRVKYWVVRIVLNCIYQIMSTTTISDVIGSIKVIISTIPACPNPNNDPLTNGITD